MHRDRKRLHADRQIILSAADWCFLKPEIDAPAYYQRLARSIWLRSSRNGATGATGDGAGSGAEVVEPRRRGRLNRAEKRELMVAQLREQIAQRAGRTPV